MLPPSSDVGIMRTHIAEIKNELGDLENFEEVLHQIMMNLTIHMLNLNCHLLSNLVSELHNYIQVKIMAKRKKSIKLKVLF